MSSPASIVHIGYHKTASTWFQRRFYPRVQSHRYLHDRDAIRFALVNPHAFAFDASAARARLGIDGGAPVIVCEENLSGSFETGGHMGALSKEHAARIHALLPQARIVIFVRHQVDIIASAYAQYVKRGGTHRPERFLFPGRYRKGPWRDPGKKPLFAFEHFTYVGLIAHYRALFGTDNVHVFAYEDFRRDRREFLAAYAHTLSLTVNLDEIDLKSANTSFRHRTLALARTLYLLTYRGVADKRCLVPTRHYRRLRTLLDRFEASRFAGRTLSSHELLGPEIVAFIEQFYAQSNRDLAAATGLPLAAYAYPGMLTPERTAAGEPANPSAAPHSGAAISERRGGA